MPEFAQDAVGTDNIRNLLRNGSFAAVVRRSDPMRLPAPTLGTTPGIPASPDNQYERADHYVRDLRSVYEVVESPDQPFLSAWAITGKDAFVDVNPIIGGVRRISRDGGLLVRVGFLAKSQVDLVQNVTHLLSTLRGQPVSLGLTVYALTGTVAVKVALVVNGVSDFRQVSSSSISDRQRVGFAAQVAPGATTIEVRITCAGTPGAQIGLSGAILAMGAYDSPIPYGDNPVDRQIPAGTVVMFNGAACPAGYRRLSDSIGAIPMGVPASPNTAGKQLEAPESIPTALLGLGTVPIDMSASTHANVGSLGHSHRVDGEFGITEEGETERFEISDPRNPPPMRVSGESSADPDGLDVGITTVGVVERRWDPRPLPPGTPVPPKLADTPTSDDAYVPVLTRQHKHVIDLAGSTMPPYFDLLFCEKI